MKQFLVLIQLTLGMMFCSTLSQAQKQFMHDGIYSTDAIVPSSFSNKLFQDLLLHKINRHLDSLNLEGFEVDNFFVSAAEEHALLMAKNGNAGLDGKGKHKTISSRLISAGGSGIGGELVSRITIRVSNEYLTYETLADLVMSRWLSGKNLKELTAQKYFFGGIYGKIDDSEKKIFVSMYIGNYASFKNNKPDFSNLKLKPTVKTFGVKPFDESICKKTNAKSFKILDIEDNLLINENREIVFKHNDLKLVKKLISGANDGLAVDIIQKAQFADCNSADNSVDYSNSVNIGHMTKPVYTKNLFKNNIAENESEGKRNKVSKFEVILGKLPENIDEKEIELNLILIKDNHACDNIITSKVNKQIYNYSTKTDLIPDTVIFENNLTFDPNIASSDLSFRINFEQGKSQYEPKEIQPVLTALNNANFIINKVIVTSYTSIEGNKSENKTLQKKRADSIMKELEQNQFSNLVDTIVMALNFDDLKADVKGTPFEEIATMTLEDAIEYVNANVDKMEHILENHRYAEITINITRDTNGEKEQSFVSSQFNKAVETRQLDHALAIQKHIIKRILDNTYDEKAISDMRIPQAKEFAGLNMNKVWLIQHVFGDPINEDYLKAIDDLYNFDKSNIYIDYNDALCKILLTDNISDENTQKNLQSRIDNLYNTSINVELVDALNIELQYQLMNLYKDSMGNNNHRVNESLSKIRNIVYFDALKWENSLKFATIFINHGDYDYALHLLEPYIFDDKSPIELLTTYASICPKVNNKVYSNNFFYALQKIAEANKSEFCSLFNGANSITMQSLVNIKIKELYCNTCNK
jgi:outer membrane protein OmpA-like peptidoglycan-associated protein